MAFLPISPKLDSYRGGDARKKRRRDEWNALANRIADHLNRRIATDPAERQQYLFHEIAGRVGCAVDDVRRAIGDGGWNGITIGVTDRDREMLRPFG